MFHAACMKWNDAYGIENPVIKWTRAMCFEASNIQKAFICIFITIGSGSVSLYDCSCKIQSSVIFSALLKLNQSLSLGYWILELLGSVRALLKKIAYCFRQRLILNQFNQYWSNLLLFQEPPCICSKSQVIR